VPKFVPHPRQKRPILASTAPRQLTLLCGRRLHKLDARLVAACDCERKKPSGREKKPRDEKQTSKPGSQQRDHSRPTIDEIVKLFRYGSPDERSWAGRWLRAHKAGLRSVATRAALRNIAAVNARRVKREQLLLLTPPLLVDDAALVLDILKQAPAGISIEALNSRLLSQRLGWGRAHAALTALLKIRRARDEYRSIAGGRLAHLWFAT
jgi:hypothetical protein